MKINKKHILAGMLGGLMALGACLVPGTAIAREIPDGVSVQAQDILDGMTLHEKICQMMVSYQYTMMDGSTRVGATETGEPLQRALEAYPVGGILYDAASMKSHDQLRDLVAAADSYCEIPMLFTIDEEGGRVSRIGATIGYNVGDGHLLDPMQSYELSLIHI